MSPNSKFCYKQCPEVMSVYSDSKQMRCNYMPLLVHTEEHYLEVKFHSEQRFS